MKDQIEQLKNIVEQLAREIDKDYFIGYDENDKLVLKKGIIGIEINLVDGIINNF